MKAIYFLFLGLIGLGSCTPITYLSTPVDFKYQVNGLIMECFLKDSKNVFKGEIIEVSDTAVTILPLNQITRIITIPESEILKADIIISLTSNKPKPLNSRAFLPNITSLGHGFFSVLTLPINLAVTSSISADIAMGTYRVKYPAEVEWKDLKKFARFPQGLPEGIDPEAII